MTTIAALANRDSSGSFLPYSSTMATSRMVGHTHEGDRRKATTVNRTVPEMDPMMSQR